MKLCYFDESGDSATLNSAVSDIQPMLTISAIVIDANFLPYITRDFLAAKRKYFPGLKCDPDHPLSLILTEIKGGNLRKQYKEGRNQARHATQFLEHILSLLQKYGPKVFGALWVKALGRPVHEIPVYTTSVQYLYGVFQKYLEEVDDTGFVIGDSRNARQNATVAHGIFSGKQSIHGDKYHRVLEMPTFSHSQNSAMLQIADLLASAIVWPIGINTFCDGELTSVHVVPRYTNLKRSLLKPYSLLQYRYLEGEKWSGGLFIRNLLNRRRPSDFFKQVPTSPKRLEFIKPKFKEVRETAAWSPVLPNSDLINSAADIVIKKD